MQTEGSHLALVQRLNQIFVNAKFCTAGNFHKYGFSKEGHEFYNWTENKWNVLVLDGLSWIACWHLCRDLYVSYEEFEQVSKYFPFVMLNGTVIGTRTHENFTYMFWPNMGGWRIWRPNKSTANHNCTFS